MPSLPVVAVYDDEALAADERFFFAGLRSILKVLRIDETTLDGAFDTPDPGVSVTVAPLMGFPSESITVPVTPRVLELVKVKVTVLSAEL